MISPKEAFLTLNNNIQSTFNLIWAVMKNAPDCHIIKLGTMGEYGTSNIDIEEGWIDIHHKGRTDTFLYPRQNGSLYHTNKILDTDLLWFYVRLYGIRVTDLMQGPVYGFLTEQFSITQLANKVVQSARLKGVRATIQHLPNPRQEAEKHYYRAAHDGYSALGLMPHLLTPNELTAMIEKVATYKTEIQQRSILPRIFWNDKKSSGNRQHPITTFNPGSPEIMSGRQPEESREICRFVNPCRS